MSGTSMVLPEEGEIARIPSTETRRPESSVVLDRSATRWWAMIAAIILAALVLRLAAINVQSFWYDEAVAANLSQQGAWKLLSGAARDNGNPPLYWVVLSLSTFDPLPSESVLRLPSIVFGVLTVMLVAVLARDVFNERAGAIAAVIFALSPLSLDLSTEARAYPMLQLLAATNILFFLRWVDSRARQYLLGYTLTLATACLTHYYAAFLPISQGAALLLYRRDWAVLWRWVAAGLLAASIGAFWIPTFFAQLGTSGNLSRMGDRWLYQFIITPLAFAFGRTLVWRDSSKLLLAAASLAAVVLLWLPAFMAFVASLPLVRKTNDAADNRRSFAVGVLSLCVTATMIIPLIAAFLGSPMFHHRAASVALPALVALAAGGMARLSTIWRGLAVGALLCFSVVSNYNYFREPLRDDWRSASQYMFERFGDSEMVLFDTDIEVVSFGYYAKRSGQPLPETIGLMSGLANGKLKGIRLPSEDRKLVDFIDEVKQRDSFWLATCVPATPTGEYVAFFRQQGFEPRSQHEFHRIDVVEFVRQLPEEAHAR